MMARYGIPSGEESHIFMTVPHYVPHYRMLSPTRNRELLPSLPHCFSARYFGRLSVNNLASSRLASANP